MKGITITQQIKTDRKALHYVLSKNLTLAVPTISLIERWLTLYNYYIYNYQIRFICIFLFEYRQTEETHNYPKGTCIGKKVLMYFSVCLLRNTTYLLQIQRKVHWYLFKINLPTKGGDDIPTFVVKIIGLSLQVVIIINHFTYVCKHIYF